MKTEIIFPEIICRVGLAKVGSGGVRRVEKRSGRVKKLGRFLGLTFSPDPIWSIFTNANAESVKDIEHFKGINHISIFLQKKKNR